jgi:predicted DNA-binding ribbon-helix-helix protein
MAKDKKKSVYDTVAEKYNEAAKSGKLGSKARVAVEENEKKKKKKY